MSTVEMQLRGEICQITKGDCPGCPECDLVAPYIGKWSYKLEVGVTSGGELSWKEYVNPKGVPAFDTQEEAERHMDMTAKRLAEAFIEVCKESTVEQLIAKNMPRETDTIH